MPSVFSRGDWDYRRTSSRLLHIPHIPRIHRIPHRYLRITRHPSFYYYLGTFHPSFAHIQVVSSLPPTHTDLSQTLPTARALLRMLKAGVCKLRTTTPRRFWDTWRFCGPPTNKHHEGCPTTRWVAAGYLYTDTESVWKLVVVVVVLALRKKHCLANSRCRGGHRTYKRWRGVPGGVLKGNTIVLIKVLVLDIRSALISLNPTLISRQRSSCARTLASSLYLWGGKKQMTIRILDLTLPDVLRITLFATRTS
ncbi:hypothetical protein F5051DRAFT_174462 [Lentinula edodes]|nr:hypothetical protein F5051DRAFT_174462 [Lentinula edodes]